MPKKTHKKTDTKVKNPNFIRFGKVGKKLLNEVWIRTTNERNDAMNMVLDELGVLERIKQAGPERVIMKTGDGPADVLGVEILPVPAVPGSPTDLPPPNTPLADPPKDPPSENPKDIKSPEKTDETKEPKSPA